MDQVTSSVNMATALSMVMGGILAAWWAGIQIGWAKILTEIMAIIIIIKPLLNSMEEPLITIAEWGKEKTTTLSEARVRAL